MQDQPQITVNSLIIIAALALIWGSAFTVIRLGLVGMSPMWLAAARISIGAALNTALWGLWVGNSTLATSALGRCYSL